MDRELLELAAFAAGYDVKWRTKADIGMLDALMVDIPIDSQKLRWKTNPYNVWDPLTDDGDALRLAVKLDIVPQSKCYDDYDKLFASACIYKDGGEVCSVREPYTDDPYSATRRAIVRAAAVLGSKK